MKDLNDLKEKTKDTIDATAEAAKRAAAKVIDTSKEAVHAAGQTIEEQGKKLRKA